jgi:hypothetical protein
LEPPPLQTNAETELQKGTVSMTGSPLLRLARRLVHPQLTRRPGRSPTRGLARPRLEVLEDRTLLSFGMPILSATGVRPTGIAVGDFNGDGKLDVVTANTIDNTISVLMGRGDGTFQAPVNYTVGMHPVRIAVGALHGGTLPDLVVANNASNSVTVLLNNGNGTFRTGATVSTDTGPRSLVLADFNGDGKLDLAVACSDGYSSFNIDVFLGNGDGTFGPKRQLASHEWGALGPSDLVVGDFNRDGKLDIVSANDGYTVTYFQGNGDGTFLTGVGSPSNHRNVGILASDLRGVGILDLVSAGNTYGWVTVMRGNGNGTFQAPQGYGFSGSNSAGAADFRGTGKPDLVVVDDSGDTLTTLLNAGDGTFPTTQTYPLANGPGAQGAGLAVGDFTGDGKPDVVVALTQFNEVAVLPDQVGVSSLAVSAASSTVAGASLSVTVTAKDAGGNTLPSYTGHVHFAATDSNAVLPADYTFTAADAGTHTFTVTLKSAGSQTVTVSDAGAGLSTPASVTVSPAAAHHLGFGQQPGTAVAGQVFGPAVTVRVLDQFGNVVTTDSSSVVIGLAANPGGGTLSGTTTTGAINGVATFANLSLDKAAAGYALQATDGTLAGATSTAFTVNPAAAHHLAFGPVPANVAAGQPLNPPVQVSVLDQFGNVVTTDASSVAVAIATNPAGGTLSGTTTVGASSGVATFSTLSVDKPGMGYTLRATDGTLAAALSASFNIVSVSAANSTVGFASPTVVAGNTDLVTLVVKDAGGNPVTGLVGTAFSLALSGGTSAGTFGAVTETATHGTYTATFTGTTVGTASTLTAAVVGVILTTTSTITVLPGAVSGTNSTLSFASPILASGGADTLTLVLKDTVGNAITGLAGSAFSFALSGGTSAGTFGTVTETSTRGTYTATFTGTAAGTASTLTATVNGVTLAATPTVQVLAGGISPASSTVAFASSAVVTGHTDLITLVVRDAAGNPVGGLAGSSFVLALSGGTSAGTFGAVTETATRGTYTATFTATTVGTPSTLTAAVAGVSLGATSSITVTPTDVSVIGLFGPGGLMRWSSGTGTWTPLTPYSPTSAVVDAAGDVVGLFAGSGIWRWAAATGVWTQIDPYNPTSISTDAAGDLVALFGGAGIWRWNVATGVWSQIDPYSSTTIAVDAAGNVVGLFGGAGLWRWNVMTGAWTEIDPYSPTSIAVDAAGDVVGVFAGSGVWRWNVTTGVWTQIHPSTPATFAVDAAGDVVAVFGGAGLWRWDVGTGAWAQIHTSTPQALVADSAGDVVAVFGDGVYRWVAGVWMRISTIIPTGIAVYAP